MEDSIRLLKNSMVSNNRIFIMNKNIPLVIIIIVFYYGSTTSKGSFNHKYKNSDFKRIGVVKFKGPSNK